MGKRFKTAVYCGRFQPFHLAHLETVRLALSEAETVIIAVGSSNRGQTIKNPFLSEQRIGMIQKAVTSDAQTGWRDDNWQEIDPKRIKFLQVRDYMYNDYRWAGEVYSKAVDAGADPGKETGFYGCYKDSGSYFIDMFPQFTVRETDYLYNLNATDIRQTLFTDVDSLEEKWGKMLSRTVIQDLKNFVHTDVFTSLKMEYEYLDSYKKSFSTSPFPPTFLTTDCVVYKAGHVLLIERGRQPHVGFWGVPGGFVDQNERIKDAAIRELLEETNIKISKDDLYKAISKEHIFDHPKRSLRGRVVTHAFLINLGNTGPLPQVKAGDDANRASFRSMYDIMQNERKFFDDHLDIVTHMTSSL